MAESQHTLEAERAALDIRTAEMARAPIADARAAFSAAGARTFTARLQAAHDQLPAGLSKVRLRDALTVLNGASRTLDKDMARIEALLGPADVA